MHIVTVIAGDFNHGEIQWDDYTVDNSSYPSSQFAEEFLLAMSECALYQHVAQPTRFRPPFRLHI